MHAADMSKRRFRQVAHVAGLTFEGFPGTRKSARQMPLSRGLLFDVFRKYDPGNLRLRQAGRELLESQLAASRRTAARRSMRIRRLVTRSLETISPLAYPLLSSACAPSSPPGKSKPAWQP
jgi:ATP-dependent Lhr-like helicase